MYTPTFYLVFQNRGKNQKTGFRVAKKRNPGKHAFFSGFETNAILSDKTRYHCEISAVGPRAIYQRIINYVKHSFSMMFIILTHDNQSTLSSFSVFLSFVTDSTVAKKSPLVPLI